MQYRGGLKPNAGIGFLLGIGCILVAFTTVRAMHSDASVTSRIVGIVIPAALALTLFAGAIGMYQYKLEEHALRIAGWTCLGTLVFTVAVVLNITGIDLVQPDFLLSLYLVTTAAAAGAVLGFLIGMYDAHQTRIKQNLADKHDEAATLNQRLSVLNRVVRHDLRTQAQLLYGDADQLESNEITPETGATNVRTKADRLACLSEDAHQLQQIFDGNDIGTETVDIVSLVRESGANVQDANESLTIEYDLPETQRVQAPPMFKKAVQQLLANVVEHTENPRAKVSLTTTHSPEPSAQLTITDTGPGIPDLEMIHNTAETESSLEHSRGLGLWFVKWVVETGDGTLDIRSGSATDAGTVVRITLPMPE